MSNIILLAEKRMNKVIDETYLFLDKITINYDIDNNVYYDEYYLFCKNIYDFMHENNINKDFYNVIDSVICNVVYEILAKKDVVNIKNIISYAPIYLKINFYKFYINPINELKIINLKAKILKDIIELPRKNDIQFKKR
jgi:hypothetical protein